MITWSPENEVNNETVGIHSWTKSEIVAYRVKEMHRAANAVNNALPDIERAADIITNKIQNGRGRVITVGAGGSGVIAMAVMRELPQNHREIDPHKFLYQIAGGTRIFDLWGCEELEDSAEEGERDMDALDLSASDSVICVSATGRTVYTCASARAAKKKGAYTIGLICQAGSRLAEEVDLPVLIDTGPEMFFGATCEKAATAQKGALTAIMDAVVIGLGITDDNVCRAREVHQKARLRREFLERGRYSK